VATPLSSPRKEFPNWISSRLTLIHSNPAEIAVAFQGQNNGGALSSTDAGTTWLLESAPPTRYSAVGFAPDGTLYAISAGPSSVAQEGLYRRENNGSWTPLGPDQGPLYESDLNTMRFSLNNPNLILLGGEDFGVAGFEGTIWRSTDAGGSWTKVYEVGDFHRITEIEIIEDGTDQNMVAVWNSESAITSVARCARLTTARPGLTPPAACQHSSEVRDCALHPVIRRPWSCPRRLASRPADFFAPLTAVRPGLLRASQETRPLEMLRVIRVMIRRFLLRN
jgi:photosystem II stability/assembly factor-like uncharacterized protein